MNYIVTKPVKSRGIAILLVTIFGPFGMFYSTIFGALMTLIPIPAILLFCFYILNKEGGFVNNEMIIIILLIAYYLSWYVWAVIGVNKYNKKITKNASIPYSTNSNSEETNYYQQYYKSESNTSYYVIALILLILVITGIFYKKEVIFSAINTTRSRIKSTSNKELVGKYVCNNKCIYPSFEFKGNSTVVVGNIFVCSYVLDKNYVRITTDKTDLLLKITDDNTLTGEGFAKGIYIKAFK